MSLFTKVQNLLKEIDYPCYMEAEDIEWCSHCDEMTDIYCVSGNELYTLELTEGVYTQDDAFFVNYDTGFGDTVTKVLPISKKLSWDEFYDKYEEII